MEVGGYRIISTQEIQGVLQHNLKVKHFLLNPGTMYFFSVYTEITFK